MYADRGRVGDRRGPGRRDTTQRALSGGGASAEDVAAEPWVVVGRFAGSRTSTVTPVVSVAVFALAYARTADAWRYRPATTKSLPCARGSDLRCMSRAISRVISGGELSGRTSCCPT
jgi:hypothetical protein